MKRFSVLKGFNNNVVLCNDMVKGKECILVGRGIGFNANSENIINDESKIDKVFYLDSDSTKSKLEDLYSNVHKDIVGATEEALAAVNKVLKKELNEKIHVTLLDHIAFAIERLKSNIEIKNPFLYETRLLYEEEFKAATLVYKIINKKLKLELPKDEIGFITMHLHAALHNNKISKTASITNMIGDTVAVIERELGYKINKEDMSFARLITHLRFAFDRIYNNVPIENVLVDDIKEKLSEQYKISEKAAEYIENKYRLKIPKDEVGYIALHVGRVSLMK